MGVETGDAVAELFRYERRRLVALAYRMLGTVSQAEDAVAYALICSALLVSAGRKYVGQWLPEPVPANVSLVRRQIRAGRSPGRRSATELG